METVLVVDDDPLQRNRTMHDLTLAHYLVLEASGAAEAAQLASSFREPIDLIIIDQGGDFRRRANIVTEITLIPCSIPILVVSNSSEEEVALSFLLANKDFAFLKKPFSSAALIQAVRQTLRKAAKQCERGDR